MSKIEWTGKTWNPVSGCTRKSRGCDNCYAVSMTKRLESMGLPKYAGLVNLNKNHFNGVVKCHEDDLLKPLKWKKPTMCFVNSMSDLFHKDVPFEFIDKVFAVMALTPHITYQILTKRPERMAEYFKHLNVAEFKHFVFINALHKHMPIAEKYRRSDNLLWPLPNVWLGTSVENQEAADERIPYLLECPAAVQFLSCEPLLGPLDLALRGFNGAATWVIAGGESGAKRRPHEIEWFRSLRDQCQAANVPFFMKQLDKVAEIPEDLLIREFPKVIE